MWSLLFLVERRCIKVKCFGELQCDTKFTLETWVHFMKKIGTKLKFNTTCHPQIDG